MDYNQIQRFLMIVKHSNLSGAAKMHSTNGRRRNRVFRKWRNAVVV